MWTHYGKGQAGVSGPLSVCVAPFSTAHSLQHASQTQIQTKTQIVQTWTSESGNSHLWRVVNIEMYGHFGLDLFIGVDCSVFLIHVRFVNSMKEPVHLIIRF